MKANYRPLNTSLPLSPSARAAAALSKTEGFKNGAQYTSPHVAGGLGNLAARSRSRTTVAVSRYGPQKCVSTWRSEEGHCIVQTACKDVDISAYEFGLICVDSKG